MGRFAALKPLNDQLKIHHQTPKIYIIETYWSSQNSFSLNKSKDVLWFKPENVFRFIMFNPGYASSIFKSSSLVDK